jgi:phytoene dehydrogenase-like protein
VTGPDHDVAIVGAGPNGLTAAAYLARAGARVVVFEARFERGGTLASDDLSTPFLYNQGQLLLPLGAESPPVRDLGLAEHAVAFLEPQIPFVVTAHGETFAVRRGGRGLGGDLEAMLAEASAAAVPLLFQPATRAAAWVRREGNGVGRLAHATPDGLARLAADDRAALIVRYACALAGFADGDEPLGAIGAVALARLFEPVLVAGGSKGLANGLFRVAARAGARCPISARVIAAGPGGGGVEVRLADGRRSAARAVISTLDPLTTFGHVLAGHVPEDLREVAQGWRLDPVGAFIAHFGIRGDPPGATEPVDEDPLVRIVGFSSAGDVAEHLRAVARGELPARPAGHLTTTTRHDPLQASPGPYGPLHTLRYETAAPYAHPGGDWDRARVAHRRACWDLIRSEVDGADRATLLFEFADTPRDLERRFGTARGGSLRQGALHAGQTLEHRPHPSCVDGRTPVAGVYLGGGGTHPGIPGALAGGLHAAAAVCADLGFERWWPEPLAASRA